MSIRLTLRCAAAEDETATASLWKDCGLTTSYNNPGEDFRRALAQSNSDILLAVAADNKIVGSVMVGHDGHRGWLYYVAAHPAYRKQNIGRRLTAAAEEWLRQRGVVKVMLLVRDTNTQVVDFYQRLGFTTTPRVVMEKWLIEPKS